MHFGKRWYFCLGTHLSLVVRRSTTFCPAYCPRCSQQSMSPVGLVNKVQPSLLTLAHSPCRHLRGRPPEGALGRASACGCTAIFYIKRDGSSDRDELVVVVSMVPSTVLPRLSGRLHPFSTHNPTNQSKHLVSSCHLFLYAPSPMSLQ